MKNSRQATAANVGRRRPHEDYLSFLTVFSGFSVVRGKSVAEILSWARHAVP